MIGVSRFLRAPKKGKKGDDKVVVESNDLINIFVEKTDPEIKPLNEYPPWLGQMLQDIQIHKPTTWAMDAAKGGREPMDPIRLKHMQRFCRRTRINLQRIMPMKDFFNPKVDDLNYDWDIDEEEDVEEEYEHHLAPLYKLAAGVPYKIEQERERLRMLGLLEQDYKDEEDELAEEEKKKAEEAPKTFDRKAEAAKRRKADREADEEVERMMKKNK